MTIYEEHGVIASTDIEKKCFELIWSGLAITRILESSKFFMEIWCIYLMQHFCHPADHSVIDYRPSESMPCFLQDIIEKTVYELPPDEELIPPTWHAEVWGAWRQPFLTVTSPALWGQSWCLSNSTIMRMSRCARVFLYKVNGCLNAWQIGHSIGWLIDWLID